MTVLSQEVYGGGEEQPGVGDGTGATQKYYESTIENSVVPDLPLYFAPFKGDPQRQFYMIG